MIDNFSSVKAPPIFIFRCLLFGLFTSIQESYCFLDANTPLNHQDLTYTKEKKMEGKRESKAEQKK